MEITKATMENALPHIEAAERQLEILKYFVTNKDRLSLDIRVPVYFNNLVRAVVKMQELFYDQQEFVELFAQTVGEVSKDREYHFTTTNDHDGNIYFDIHGLLPLEKVQSHMLLTGGVNEATVTVSGSSFTRDRETT